MKRISIGRTGKYALVDDADYERVSAFRWWITKEGAAYTRMERDGKILNTYLHRFITDALRDMVVDHKNHNRLDNRRKNLRVCKQGMNCLNKIVRSDNVSGYKGVGIIRGKYYQATITPPGTRQHIYLGSFKTAIEAAEAYNAAAEQLHGEFALLNNFEEAK